MEILFDRGSWAGRHLSSKIERASSCSGCAAAAAVAAVAAAFASEASNSVAVAADASGPSSASVACSYSTNSRAVAAASVAASGVAVAAAAASEAKNEVPAAEPVAGLPKVSAAAESAAAATVEDASAAAAVAADKHWKPGVLCAREVHPQAVLSPCSRKLLSRRLWVLPRLLRRVSGSTQSAQPSACSKKPACSEASACASNGSPVQRSPSVPWIWRRQDFESDLYVVARLLSSQAGQRNGVISLLLCG